VESVAFAELLENVTFGGFGGFELRDGLVEHGIEGLTGGIDLLKPGVDEGVFKLAIDHGDALEERFNGGSRTLLGGGTDRHLEAVQDREQLLDKAKGGIADGFLAFAGGAFAVVVEIGTNTEVMVPVFVGLGGAGPELIELLVREAPGGGRARSRFRGRGGGLRQAGVIRVEGVSRVVWIRTHMSAVSETKGQNTQERGAEQPVYVGATRGGWQGSGGWVSAGGRVDYPADTHGSGAELRRVSGGAG
jgi:hypothetical protein